MCVHVKYTCTCIIYMYTFIYNVTQCTITRAVTFVSSTLIWHVSFHQDPSLLVEVHYQKCSLYVAWPHGGVPSALYCMHNFVPVHSYDDSFLVSELRKYP